MFDLLHFLYEDDVQPTVENGLEIKSRFRETIYPALYEREYAFALSGSRHREFDEPMLASPMTTQTKPYFPPTDPEMFSQVLAPPVGG